MMELLTLKDDDCIYDTIVKEHLNQRKIILNEDVDDNAIENICLMIMQWNKEDKNLPTGCRKPIYIYINSDGGDVITGYQILSSILTSVTPVITIGFAKCASMASYILAAGHKRYCFPNTIVLYHDGQTGYVSSSNKGKDIQKFYDNLEKRMTDFMIAHSNMSAEFLEEIKDREYYMFAEEAKERGIIDGIIGQDIELDSLL
ncbi:ATP-dependent Clp protease proteolytic subunit [Blautia intestinalis]|uniref:ATP-dependent Clp protease proteolytic subunit n=1 Tax=Blautia intestinalis TaxID=2763028 RepID=UPI0022E2B459|nr:ATP-dependent Clp protease proteolytic subunit [Blautia intestinalis]